MNDLKTPAALKDGCLVYSDDPMFENGYDCDCTCPGYYLKEDRVCGAKLILRRGPKRRAHFAYPLGAACDLHNQVQEWIFEEFDRRIGLAKERLESHGRVLGWSYTFPPHSDLVIPHNVVFTGVSREFYNSDNKRRYDIKVDIVILPYLVDRILSCFQNMASIDRRDDMLDIFDYDKAFNDTDTLEQFILWHMFDTHFRASKPFYEAQVGREEKLIGLGLPPDTDDLPSPNSRFGLIENLEGTVVDRLVKESHKKPIPKSCLDRMPDPKNTDHFVIEVNSTNRKKRDFIDEVSHEKRWVFEVEAEAFWNEKHTVERMFQCGQWLWPEPTLFQ